MRRIGQDGGQVDNACSLAKAVHRRRQYPVSARIHCGRARFLGVDRLAFDRVSVSKEREHGGDPAV